MPCVMCGKESLNLNTFFHVLFILTWSFTMYININNIIKGVIIGSLLLTVVVIAFN